MRIARSLLVAVGLAACGGGDVAPDLTVEQAGTFGAAATHFSITDATSGRVLTAEAWVPTTTDTSAAVTPIEALEPDPIRTQYAGLLASAPACANRTLPVAPETAPAAGTFPLVLFSHCHACTRLSSATTAARLASHGFVVVSVDHAGDTLWDHLGGHDADLSSAELEVRAADIRAVLDAVAAGATPVSASADLTHVGVFGHSFGAVTAGRVVQLEPRITAAAALCAPMENPLIPGVTLADITTPLMFIVAEEDNSITELGNQFIRNNFTAAATPAWKIEVPDAGHWSVSDLDGLVDIFAPGCGSATRQTDDSPFTYLDPPTGRAIAAAYVTAFFRATLTGDAGARAYLEQASPSFAVALDVQHHE